MGGDTLGQSGRSAGNIESMAPPVIHQFTFESQMSWLAWSHDGSRLACGSDDKLAVCAVAERRIDLLHPLSNRTRFGDWSPDNTLLAIVEGSSIAVRNSSTGELLAQSADSDGLRYFSVWSPTRSEIATNSYTGFEILSASTGERLQTYDLEDPIYDALWAGEDTLIVCGSDGIALVSTSDSDKERPTVLTDESTTSVACARSGVIAGTTGSRIRILFPDTRMVVLEHHDNPVSALSFSSDSMLLASFDKGGVVAIWDTSTWTLLVSWSIENCEPDFYSLQFSPAAPILACVGPSAILFFDLSDLHASARPSSVFYTTAKIALVGDSGVGKTGLGWVLTHPEGFKEHPSTHGEQFWVAERLSTTRTDGTQCETVVWDLAGQPDYRLIHSLFIDDADVALIVFDPTNRQEPLKGVEFWLRALGGSKEKRARSILVGARTDRGTGILTEAELQAFATSEGVAGGYIATSALRGDNIETLLERVSSLIEWDKRPATVTLQTFKEIKDHVLQLKETGSGVGVLVTQEELQDILRHRNGTTYDLAAIATATKHLADHGYVRLLRKSTGERFILLAPDLLNNLAASMVLEARRNPKGLGALDERRVLSGGYSFQELSSLEPRDREILLDAATTLFIEHNICFRETLGSDTFLIYPSLINQNKPPVDEVPLMDGTAYTATGATENVYASLVVLLGYTNTFTRTNQWRNQAQYEMETGNVCGFRLAEEREGEIDLVLYFGRNSDISTRQLFQGLFEKFLLARDVAVQIFAPVACVKCNYVQARSEVIKRQRDGAQSMFCSNCGKKVALPKGVLTTPTREVAADTLNREQHVAQKRTKFETAVTSLKSYLRDTAPNAKPPSCFISYAWGNPEDERRVAHLATDLRNAGIDVIFDRWHNRPGSSITRFIELIPAADFVVMIGTTRLRQKYDTQDADPIVAAELKLINTKLRKRSQSERVLPLLLEGQASTSFPPLAEDSVFVDFRDEDSYFEQLFEVLLTLYGIPAHEPAMNDLRATIRMTDSRRSALQH